MSEFIVKTTITGREPMVDALRTRFLGSFPAVEKGSPWELIVTLSGGNQDPRPTLLNLSIEFPSLMFSVVEYPAHLGENQASHRWLAQDGEIHLAA